jgi:hypothetical protein
MDGTAFSHMHNIQEIYTRYSTAMTLNVDEAGPMGLAEDQIALE